MAQPASMAAAVFISGDTRATITATSCRSALNLSPLLAQELSPTLLLAIARGMMSLHMVSD